MHKEIKFVIPPYTRMGRIGDMESFTGILLRAFSTLNATCSFILQEHASLLHLGEKLFRHWESGDSLVVCNMEEEITVWLLGMRCLFLYWFAIETFVDHNQIWTHHWGWEKPTTRTRMCNLLDGCKWYYGSVSSLYWEKASRIWQRLGDFCWRFAETYL